MALGALVAVVISYESLPRDCAVSRWHQLPKTWFLAVRIPLTKIVSLAFVELLARSLARYDDGSRIRGITPVLLTTAGLKAAIESAELLSGQNDQFFYTILLLGIVFIGVWVSCGCGKTLLENKSWKRLTLTPLEKLALFVLVAAYVGLNLPIIVSS